MEPLGRLDYMKDFTQIVRALSWRTRQLAKGIYHTRLRLSSLPRSTIFILGCQRSGTTVLADSFERDWNVYLFREFSDLNIEPVSKEGRPAVPTLLTLRLRPFDQVANLIQRTGFPLVVCKPIVESHRANELMAAVDNSRCLWVFRHYNDVADSIVRKWPDRIHIQNLEPIVRMQRDNWRSEVVPDDVRELITTHYSADMNPHDGGALFWYARNRLLFDLGLLGSAKVMMIKYDDFVTDPVTIFRRIYDFSGTPYPGPHITRGIKVTSVGRGAGSQINEEIEAHCEILWNKLNEAYASGKQTQK